MAGTPPPPEPRDPVDWEHFALWRRVKDAILALPAHFTTATQIEGMQASDIFTLNAALGATIEQQVVASLNALRPVWDPAGEYLTHSFVRQAQVFPDVRLQRRDNGTSVLLGVELKGWYLLAKEGMPNFRFVVSPQACNPWDLLVVVPWALSNVVSGSPVVYRPFVVPARYAAEQRNYYWEFERAAGKSDRSVIPAPEARPYPLKSDRITDQAASDSGGNFGRIARYGVMTEYVAELMASDISGIPASQWLAFFKKHASQGA